MKRTLGQFAQLCGGRLEGHDSEYSAVNTDTRKLQAGELFVALKGEHFDGAAFIEAAHKIGAAGAVVAAHHSIPLSQIIVADTQAALSRAASAWRSQHPIPLIGVAGSNGKTTVKEMLASILSQAGACLATRGNLNNHIGVPLTLLRLESSHRFAVVEMGANHAGEVAELVGIGRPTIGLVTNAGAEHLEGFGSLEGVARAEGEMVAGLEPQAVAIINADDEFADLWRGMTRARIVSFGLSDTADVRARDIRADIGAEGFITQFNLTMRGATVPIELHLAGRHNVVNALAAAAGAAAAGATFEHIRVGLAAMRAVQGRLQLKRATSGAWLIDDSYNANPSSVRAGIEVLAGLEGRKWLVFADMGELGSYAQASHGEVGTFAREQGIERVYATGPLAALAVESFGAGAHWYPTVEALSGALSAALTASASDPVRVLIKGSRMNRLERVVAVLVGS